MRGGGKGEGGGERGVRGQRGSGGGEEEGERGWESA